MSDVDWVVVKQGDLSFHCLRCGAKDALELPCSIDVWLAAARAFQKSHRRCRERPQ